MSAAISFREARAADTSPLLTVIRNSFDPALLDAMTYGCEGADQYVRQQLALPRELAERRYMLAEVDGQVGACLELRLLEDTLVLNYIAVAAEHRSRRIGRQLLRCGIEAAGGARCRTMVLDVFEQNSTAASWYERLGFVEAERAVWCDLPIADGEGTPGFVSDFPQAEVCQAAFGFSQFKVTTSAGTFVIGRIGDRYFRITHVDALADRSLGATLRELDDRRNVLAILPPDVAGTALSVTGARLLNRTRRMRCEMPSLLRALA